MGVPRAVEARRAAGGPSSSTDASIQTKPASSLDRGGRGCTLGASVRPSSLSSFARGVRNKKGTPRVTLADRQIERKLAESNDPVPAQGRIYIYEGDPMRTRPENNSIYLVLGLGYASILAKCVHNCAHVWRGNRTRVWQMCAQLCTRSVGG